MELERTQLLPSPFGFDYYIVKFEQEKGMHEALGNRPWFIAGNYLSVTRWKPDFRPAKITSRTVWIRFG